MLEGRNLIVTIVGSALAFLFSYFTQTILAIPELPGIEKTIAPFSISFSLSMLVVVSIYCKNIASSLFVGIITGISIRAPDGGAVDFVLAYILMAVALALILGIYADRLRMIYVWNRNFINFSLIFAIAFMVLGWLSYNHADIFWEQGIPIGAGDDPFLDTDLPLTEILIIVLVIIFTFFLSIPVRGQKSVLKKSQGRYKIFGYILVVLGQVATLVMILFFTENIDQQTMSEIAPTPGYLQTIVDLITHQELYAVVIAPLNIFSMAAIATVATGLGLAYITVGYNRSTIEGMRGGFYVIFFTMPIGTLLYFIGSSYYLQTLFAPGGYFMGVELFPLYMTLLWAMFFFVQLIAIIILALLQLFVPSSK